MIVEGDQLLQAALSLPPTERAELIERLVESFSLPHREEIGACWAAEAESRIEAYEPGEAGSVAAEEVFACLERDEA